jgi:AraC family transcriptional regulator
MGRFLGVTETLYREGGLVVSAIAHREPRELPLHGHESAYYSLLLAGQYEEDCGRKRLAYRRGSLGFHPPHLEHRDRIGAGGGRFLAIELDGRWLERLGEFAAVLPEPALQTPAAAWIAERVLVECRAQLPARGLAIEALVLELLVEAARRLPRADSRRPGWLGRVLQRLEEDPFRSWSAEALAAEAGVHPVHLARTFRRFEGRSLGAAALHARVRAAARLLAEPDRSLADVAAAAGFADQSHFTRRFRRATGMTPGQYRWAADHSAGRAASGSTGDRGEAPASDRVPDRRASFEHPPPERRYARGAGGS